MSAISADELSEFIRGVDLNEADTRFHVIDRLFKEVLGWPAQSFRLEPATTVGFSDYHFVGPSGDVVFVLEAKRSGVAFEFPASANATDPYRRTPIRNLLCGELGAAIVQVQEYAADIGCEYAAVSNGRQFVFFRTFQRGKSWKRLAAIAISDLGWFSQNYVDAVARFGYASVVERGALQKQLKGGFGEEREIFYPKSGIRAFSHVINQNILASVLRPIVAKYFGPLTIDDPEQASRCYVNERTFDRSLRGVRTLIQDSVTPFFASLGVVETQDNESGGAIVNRVQKSVRSGRRGDVVILFGGKGSGKSTFLNRVLHHQPPQYIKKHTHVVTLDMLAVPKDEISISSAVWAGLVRGLDRDGCLDGDRDQLAVLFGDRWQIAQRQDLFGIDPASESYHRTANALIADWKKDAIYVATRLIEWHGRHHRGVVVVLDNTDQFDNLLQDYCFTLAKQISAELGCLVIISMREERFYASGIRGLLDAYQNNAFHISSPVASDVFLRRLEYVIELLASGRIDVQMDRRDDVVAFLRIFHRDFSRTPDSPLNRFISACAHGNIRMALELFSELLLSGYTNAKEMIESENGWTIQIHQVLRPLMTPTRLYYDESLSKVANIYQVRAVAGGSHFSGLRILQALTMRGDGASQSFVDFGELKLAVVGELMAMDEFKVWMDRLLAANLVEASTRQDYYSEEIDAVRVTSFGEFMMGELRSYFTYLELVCTDCGIRDESVSNSLSLLTNQENVLMNEMKRLERVEKRLEKADLFVTYLAAEEDSEKDYFGLDVLHSFVAPVRLSFDEEQGRVRGSARNTSRRRDLDS